MRRSALRYFTYYFFLRLFALVLALDGKCIIKPFTLRLLAIRTLAVESERRGAYVREMFNSGLNDAFSNRQPPFLFPSSLNP